MPIFEYACNKCGQQFETLVRSGAIPDCPSCHGTELTKRLSAFATAGGAAQAHTHAGPCGSCGNPGGPGSCSLQ